MKHRDPQLDLMMAATDSRVASKGRDGSFMRLFRYISGDNEAKQKIEMTTPVFMEGARRPAKRYHGLRDASISEQKGSRTVIRWSTTLHVVVENLPSFDFQVV